MLKIADLINRMRHNRGFGIQSPSAFHFVTQVLKEPLHYYSYEKIDRAAKADGTQGRKYYRRLFRIANYFKPESIIIVGSRCNAAKTALVEARRNAAITTIEDGDTAQLQATLQAQKGAMLIYIGECDNFAICGNAAMEHATGDTVVIIEGIQSETAKAMWWETAISSSRTVVTYDLYSAGILLFDKEKQKQNYTLKM